MTFLNGCKGSLEAAKKKLDSYYSIRSHSELYDCRDPLEPIYVNVSSYWSVQQAPQLSIFLLHSLAH
ncbi:hypothetical protein O3M35_001561 [Rhynocoris fuscipes]|uniref:Uncharacterized protein n=1 Tax=Rhynocoris fuscipes TaxID=488301 RepID=A0AAW1CPL5_9HEMI